MRTFILAAAALAALPTAAAAGVILSPVAITANNSFPSAEFGNAGNLINQGGLAVGFASGVTDFDSYIAGNPQHTSISTGAEWFTDYNETGATLDLDLGAVFDIETIAIWNDEFWGVGRITMLTSVDGVDFTVLGDLILTDHPTSASSYGPDAFVLAPATARYVQFQLGECPQPLSEPEGGCGLGEIAFEVAGGTPVPAPAMFALFGFAALGLGVARGRG